MISSDYWADLCLSSSDSSVSCLNFLLTTIESKQMSDISMLLPVLEVSEEGEGGCQECVGLFNAAASRAE